MQFSGPAASPLPDAVKEQGGFRCDGRTRCHQMSSCAEARWFIDNCPGTEMDGDHDGVPCESSLCM